MIGIASKTSSVKIETKNRADLNSYTHIRMGHMHFIFLIFFFLCSSETDIIPNNI
jgi:hypothetical protein